MERIWDKIVIKSKFALKQYSKLKKKPANFNNMPSENICCHRNIKSCDQTVDTSMFPFLIFMKSPKTFDDYSLSDG